jgi:hypothetical protein
MTIGQFLLRLSVDPDLAERFFDNPDAVLASEEFGLSEEARKILRRGNLPEIQQAVFDEDPAREISIRLRPVKGWPRPVKVES